jgi:KaiC/GvpD/RAD55 family RecA-like ATPase
LSNVPSEFQGSPALQFIQSRGWDFKVNGQNAELEVCPYCSKSGFGHCYIEIHGSASEQKNRDGLHMCHKCGKSGRLADLKSHLGITIPDVESRRDFSRGERKIEELPDIDACHEALLEDADAMDYLMNVRGFSRAIIEKTKLGIVQERYFREAGKVKALVYPYLVNGQPVFVHYRTLPDMSKPGKVPKAFSSPQGWDAPLFNGEVLRDGLKEVVMVEGEANCIAAMDKGVENIAGVPGANFKKAEWIGTLDELPGLEKIYICYDKDKVGQKAAQVLASRIGIDRCWKITLPDFDITTETGETKKGKDLNEWFTQGGGTAEAFENLKEEAVLFDVDGVSNSSDAVQEFYDELLGKGIEPKYKTQWPGLNKLVGFDPGDVCDILAVEKCGKTTFAMNLVEHMVDTYGEDGIIICLEMTRAKLARKWIAHKAQIADNIPNSPEEAEALKNAFLAAIPTVQNIAANREGDLYFCLPKYKTVEDIYDLIRQVIRRYGVKWIVLDNLQRLADSTPKGKSSRTEHMSSISKVLSQIAKEYDIQMIRILQPHRVADGKVVTSDNTDGSSQIAKDCDCNITLHRNKLGGEKKADQIDMMIGSETAQAFANETLCTVGLSRYSSGGNTWLMYDGAKSTFYPFTVENQAAVQAEMNKDKGFVGQLEAAVAAKVNQSEQVPGEIQI